MTLIFPLRINQGETTNIVFPVVDADGQPVDVTGWSARAQVRKGPGLPVLYEWVDSASNITLAGTAVTLHVDPVVSSAWTWGSGRYDLELTDTSGAVSRLAEGPVRVSAEITT